MSFLLLILTCIRIEVASQWPSSLSPCLPLPLSSQPSSLESCSSVFTSWHTSLNGLAEGISLCYPEHQALNFSAVFECVDYPPLLGLWGSPATSCPLSSLIILSASLIWTSFLCPPCQSPKCECYWGLHPQTPLQVSWAILFLFLYQDFSPGKCLKISMCGPRMGYVI